MEALRLDHQMILEYQKNEYPFLMIDVAEEVVPGVSVRGYKNLTANDWFFKCHFPGDPSMPGLLQVEAMVQMSALMVVTLPGYKGKVCYLTSANKLLFKRKVLPGDRFDIESKMTFFKRGIGKCEARGAVNGQLAAQAEFNLVVANSLDEFRPVVKSQPLEEPLA